MKNNRKISIFFFYIGIVLSGCNKYIDTKGRLISSNGFSLKSYEDYNDFRCFSNMVSTMDTFRTVPTHFKVKLPKGIQSSLQSEFEARVTNLGYKYYLVRSLEDFKNIILYL